jgi:small subunit ribosomal protein S18b
MSSTLCRVFINKVTLRKQLNYCTSLRATLNGYSTSPQTRLLGNHSTQLKTVTDCGLTKSSLDRLPVRRFTQSSVNYTDTKHAEEEVAEQETGEDKPAVDSSKLRPIIDVQTSIKYMNSKAYKMTYGEALVWQPYRRNHKGSIAPEKTRKTCIRKGMISTGNPCPICRDEYLVLHPENAALLKQFIMPQTGVVLSYQKTGLCQVQQKNLLVALEQAWDQGYLDSVQPFRRYDYSEYYQQPISEQRTNNQ